LHPLKAQKAKDPDLPLQDGHPPAITFNYHPVLNSQQTPLCEIVGPVEGQGEGMLLIMLIAARKGFA